MKRAMLVVVVCMAIATPAYGASYDPDVVDVDQAKAEAVAVIDNEVKSEVDAPVGNNNKVEADPVVVAPVQAPVQVQTGDVASDNASNNTVVANDTVDVGDVNVLSQDNDTINDNDTTQDNDTVIDNSTSSIDRSFNRDSIVDADIRSNVKSGKTPAVGQRTIRSQELVLDLEGGIEGTAYASGKGLPYTGIEAIGLAKLALFSILLGVSLLYIGRRRESWGLLPSPT